ncbi:asialoglycoprotein receptor 1-like [Hemicordylus capensis]|uniref:asialoglycoprotein receptor 1-like n=1 Tax=Hemicordylus capensis TaxID=884348 RepID=UPI00230352C8|nr:asialoglycoprotein receptor 1-like [Hemicordylus capensis]XP_053122468.1 asialoglycoprotein receptor 1-like [Hemicordylus capensis]XP_053122469.1 asialoglycoprotein receptor 1-like [Hemicordylus capensis]
MINNYQDLTTLDVEDDGETHVQKAPPRLPPTRLWRPNLCPSRRLVLILLGLSGILTLTAIVFGAKSNAFSSQLQGVQETLQSMNQSVGAEMASLQTQGKDTELKMTQAEGEVKQLTEQTEADNARLLAQALALQSELRSTICDLEDFKHSRTGGQETCCPKGWVDFRKNCYWESRADMTWEDAKVDCEDKGAHLAIINSYEEQRFLAVRVKNYLMWIGLTDASGSWKWLDGTSYTVREQDWAPGQPDNWYGHGLGGGEDCAHFTDNGRWNDDHCAHRHGWICEMEAKQQQ